MRRGSPQSNRDQTAEQDPEAKAEDMTEKTCKVSAVGSHQRVAGPSQGVGVPCSDVAGVGA